MSAASPLSLPLYRVCVALGRELARQEDEVIAVDGPVGRRRSSGQQQLEEKTTVMQVSVLSPASDTGERCPDTCRPAPSRL